MEIRQLEAEADELWSFVEKKANKLWLWIAMDATTRQIMAFHVGDRSRDSAKELWANIPEVSREQATFHTDQYDADTGVIPVGRHRAITKKARKTNHVERFNNTLRQRDSRLVRETLSFSKNLANHIGAIKFFICHYKLARAAQYYLWSTSPSSLRRAGTVGRRASVSAAAGLEGFVIWTREHREHIDVDIGVPFRPPHTS